MGNFVKSPIEVDITFVNKTWYSTRNFKKPEVYVLGLFQRSGKAIIRVLKDNSRETIELAMTEFVAEGSIIYCEENVLPIELKTRYDIHELKVSEKELAKGDIHISNVRNMWRDLKRQIKSVHVHVSKKHLQLYCDEVAWRINYKDLSPREKFDMLLSNCVVKDRKTSYKNLIK